MGGICPLGCDRAPVLARPIWKNELEHTRYKLNEEENFKFSEEHFNKSIHDGVPLGKHLKFDKSACSRLLKLSKFIISVKRDGFDYKIVSKIKSTNTQSIYNSKTLKSKNYKESYLETQLNNWQSAIKSYGVSEIEKYLKLDCGLLEYNSFRAARKVMIENKQDMVKLLLKTRSKWLKDRPYNKYFSDTY